MGIKNDKQLPMRVSSEFMELVDNWRRKQQEIPSRTEAIRKLVLLGLASESILPGAREALEHFRVSTKPIEIAHHLKAIDEALAMTRK